VTDQIVVQFVVHDLWQFHMQLVWQSRTSPCHFEPGSARTRRACECMDAKRTGIMTTCSSAGARMCGQVCGRGEFDKATRADPPSLRQVAASASQHGQGVPHGHQKNVWLASLHGAACSTACVGLIGAAAHQQNSATSVSSPYPLKRVAGEATMQTYHLRRRPPRPVSPPATI
jgi:hypothetical protein